MMKLIKLLALVVLALIGCARPQNNQLSESRFRVDRSMVTQTSPGNKSTAFNLFDGLIETGWFAGWEDANYPMRMVVDFGRPVSVSRIRYYDNDGEPEMLIEGKNTPNGAFVFKMQPPLTGWRQWRETRLETAYSVRYLVVQILSKQGEKVLNELEVYTTDGEAPNPPPCPECPVCPPADTTENPPPPPTDTTFRTGKILIGPNVNHYHPKERQTRFRGVRDYFPTGWAYTDKGFYGQPLYWAQKQFLGFDDYLIYMKSQGVDVLLTLMQSPDWLNGYTAGMKVNDWPPIRPGLDRTDPRSYREIAEAYRTFAMRYGSKVWPEGSYRIDPAPPRWNGDPVQVYKSGLNLVKYIEVGNEWDRWWDIGTPKYMTPQEHAALLVACHDAIKEADPNLKVVLGGLTNFDLQYLRAMQDWFTARGRAFPVDVVNVHHYSSYGNLPGVHPPTWATNGAAPPELDKDFQTISSVVAWARSIGKPCWVSEYGYDTQQGSQMYVTPYGGKTAIQIQSDLLVRSTLEYLRRGVERCYFFTLADEHNPNGLFSSCGVLYGEPTGYAEKPAFEAMANLSATLSGAELVSDQSVQPEASMWNLWQGGDPVRVVEFRRDQQSIYYYWSPTASGKTFSATVAGRQVQVTETAQTFTLTVQ